MRPGKTITHATRGCRPRALRGPLTVALMCLVVACGAGSGAIIEVADFRYDFQSPTPAAGWSYLWNENGAIGDAANYDDLGWNGNRYDSDGDSQFPVFSHANVGGIRFKQSAREKIEEIFKETKKHNS